MAESERQYFRKKYNADLQLQAMLKRKDYRNIMENILKINLQEMDKKFGKKAQEKWEEEFKKPKYKGRKYMVPKFYEVVPTERERKDHAKGKVQGIANALRLSLTDDLRKKVLEFKGKTGEQAYVKRKINSKLENQFEETIKDTFENYARKDPVFGMPANVHAIAVTELLTAISTIKARTAQNLQEQNPGLHLKKTWIHNPQLSKKTEYIREGHRRTHGVTVGLNEYFNVPLYKKIMGIPLLIDAHKMRNPHDITAPASQVIGCYCDCEYKT